MNKKDKITVIILGITGGLLFFATEVLLLFSNILAAMILLMFVIIDFMALVWVSARKDDQEKKIEELEEIISEQSRRIMNTEGQLARYKRQVAEYTNKNEA